LCAYLNHSGATHTTKLTTNPKVVSPFQSILSYERANSIPLGWINHSISSTSPNGSWQQLERGEVPLDSAWFASFARDLADEKRWRTYYARHLAKTRKETLSDAAEEAVYDVPPPPEIDTEWLYWNMMGISREVDGDMYPALQALRKAADKEPGRFVIAAMSNTSIFPDGHAFNDTTTPEGQVMAELRSNFDVFVSSAHVGMRKPDVGIYYYTLGRVAEFVRQKGWGEDGVRMEDITFLDDIGGNLRTARQVGMRTIKVDLGNVQAAVKELERATGLSLRGGGEGGKAKL
jgi:FMN phosphatase YigB (HAD superfamily)